MFEKFATPAQADRAPTRRGRTEPPDNRPNLCVARHQVIKRGNDESLLVSAITDRRDAVAGRVFYYIRFHIGLGGFRLSENFAVVIRRFIDP